MVEVKKYKKSVEASKLSGLGRTFTQPETSIIETRTTRPKERMTGWPSVKEPPASSVALGLRRKNDLP